MNNQIMKIESFDQIKTRFIEVADEKTFLKEASFAVQHFNKNAYLSKSTTASKLEAVLNIAQIGLTLNPALKLAYLIPRYDSHAKVINCVLEPSYQGLVKLITDTGSARNVYCHIVYEGDEFEETLGTQVEIIHKPKHESKTPKLFYAVAVLEDGSKQVEVMGVDEINDIRARSESYKAFIDNRAKSCIWESDYNEMGRKTVIKRLTKYLPKTDRWDKLARSIELTNTDYEASLGQINIIEDLLMNATIEHEEQTALFQELNSMNQDRAAQVISYLKERQVNPIEAGHNYNQTDIKEHTAKVSGVNG